MFELYGPFSYYILDKIMLAASTHTPSSVKKLLCPQVGSKKHKTTLMPFSAQGSLFCLFKANQALHEADIGAASVPLACIRSLSSYENGNKVLTFRSSGFRCRILN